MPIVFGVEEWPLAEAFAIARGSKLAAKTVVVRISDGVHLGRAEATPYGRYGEVPFGVRDSILPLVPEADALAADPAAARAQLAERFGAGSARNALDCALWDLEAKQKGTSVAALAGLPPPERRLTAVTISLADPETMASDARKRARKARVPRPLLKAKLGQGGAALEIERIRAIREAAPRADIILDANEGWSLETLKAVDPVAAEAGVLFIEQPLPADEDAALEGAPFETKLCADESVHTADDLPRLKDRYQVVNLKLDKTGGLTEAIRLRDAARAQGFELMIGCMVATSLAMAPATLLTEGALAVDLDGPLLLQYDRDHGISYAGAMMSPPKPELWG